MTDAEFMLEYVARKRELYANFRKIEKDEPPCIDLAQEDKQELAELDALEALAKIPCSWRPICYSDQYSTPPIRKVCTSCGALRKFREQMEGR